ncbi:MAG TPA: 2Fe-2S iron-sulfur cluster-binding protein, partial [Anaerolineaceae bacterium]|nr:2Fe-2S iron-sulfur cluster-binding protein [Anaerolineaceae bacterium]
MDELFPDEMQVEFQPVGRKVRVPAGVTLLDAAQRAGVDLVASCGGMGICGTCQAHILEGAVNPVTADEAATLDADEIAAGMRLACRVIPAGNVRVFLPASSLARAQQLQVTGVETGCAFDPLVQAVDLQLPAPSFDDLRADLSRVDEALAAAGLAPLLAGPVQLDSLSRRLRSSGWAQRLAIRPEPAGSALVACLPTGAPVLGLALDIGSTKVALYLVDLESGGTLATQGIMNPQIAYGEDVISRIAFANSGDEQRRRLQAVLVDAINQAAAGLCAQAGAAIEQICDWVVVGNTAIHHLFCGLPVEQLGLAPYVPAVQRALAFPAAEVGLQAAHGAQVYLPP